MSNNIEITPKEKRDGKDKELFKDPNDVVFTISSPLSRHRRTLSQDNDNSKRISASRQKHLKDFAAKYDNGNRAATLPIPLNGYVANGIVNGGILSGSPPTFFSPSTPPGIRINGKENPLSKGSSPLQRVVGMSCFMRTDDNTFLPYHH